MKESRRQNHSCDDFRVRTGLQLVSEVNMVILFPHFYEANPAYPFAVEGSNGLI